MGFYLRSTLGVYLTQFSANMLQHVAKITRFPSRFWACLLRTASNILLMDSVDRIPFIWIINVPNMQCTFHWIDGNRGNKCTFPMCRISEFHSSDFEWTFWIFPCVLNTTRKSTTIFMDIPKIINKMNFKDYTFGVNAVISKCQRHGFAWRLEDSHGLIRPSHAL